MRRPTKLVTSIKDNTYEERLKELDLPSLIYRRRRGDMIQMFKITSGMVRIPEASLFSPATLFQTRGHSKKMFKHHASKFVRAKSFTQRVLNDWNSLPEEIIKASTLNNFKNKLDELWKDLWYTAE